MVMRGAALERGIQPNRFLPADELKRGADPADVFRRLSLTKPTSGKSDKRRFPRKPWVVELAVLLHEEAGPRSISVFTQDLSQGGMSFVYEQFLYAGSEVLVRVDSLPDRPVLFGVVSSCVHLSGMLHRVGVRFTGRTGQGQPAES